MSTLSSTNNLATPKAADKSDKKFECDQCGKKFNRSETLKNHKVIHTYFECDQCGKSFNKKENLTAHKLSHSGEIYKRQVCSPSEIQQKSGEKRPADSDVRRSKRNRSGGKDNDENEGGIFVADGIIEDVPVKSEEPNDDGIDYDNFCDVIIKEEEEESEEIIGDTYAQDTLSNLKSESGNNHQL